MNRTEFDNKSAIERLLAVMAMLRNPDYGCPWDLQQSIRSLIPFTLEEVYEVVEAIELGDVIELEEELGDLLFQVVFYAQISKEKGDFDFDGVANAITQKLLRRHPHVFPDEDVEKFGSKIEIDTDEVEDNWERIKQQERQEKAIRKSKRDDDLGTKGAPSDQERGAKAPSALDSVPSAMPAVMRAVKLQGKAAKEGFDWQNLKPVLVKLREEIAEFEEAVAQNDQEAISNELGDVLFTTINMARHVNVEPEVALRGANKRFSDRFKWIEHRVSEAGQRMSEMSLEELDQLWDQAKHSGL
ncbi:MAG: nucleoside triphosphate pyrophosphohydrolase [Pseudohongiellaceae bacterium]